MAVNRYTLQKIALSLSIVIILNLLFNHGIQTFYSAPKFEDFCKEEIFRTYDTKEACEAVGGKWREDFIRKPIIAPGQVAQVPEITGYCDIQANCSKQYQNTLNFYNRNVFITLVILGVVSMGNGFLTVAVSAVSSGFLFGGLLSIFIGTVRYWSGMADYLRLIVLVLALAFLVWLGYKRLKDREKSNNL